MFCGFPDKIVTFLCKGATDTDTQRDLKPTSSHSHGVVDSFLPCAEACGTELVLDLWHLAAKYQNSHQRAIIIKANKNCSNQPQEVRLFLPGVWWHSDFGTALLLPSSLGLCWSHAIHVPVPSFKSCVPTTELALHLWVVRKPFFYFFFPFPFRGLNPWEDFYSRLWWQRWAPAGRAFSAQCVGQMWLLSRLNRKMPSALNWLPGTHELHWWSLWDTCLWLTSSELLSRVSSRA